MRTGLSLRWTTTPEHTPISVQRGGSSPVCLELSQITHTQRRSSIQYMRYMPSWESELVFCVTRDMEAYRLVSPSIPNFLLLYSNSLIPSYSTQSHGERAITLPPFGRSKPKIKTTTKQIDLCSPTQYNSHDYYNSEHPPWQGANYLSITIVHFISEYIIFSIYYMIGAGVCTANTHRVNSTYTNSGPWHQHGPHQYYITVITMVCIDIVILYASQSRAFNSLWSTSVSTIPHSQIPCHDSNMGFITNISPSPLQSALISTYQSMLGIRSCFGFLTN